ncbi:hypothetical protein, partial [Pseudomonas syringae group genomosp. 3]|uniref:hypothetical protein n=1 Tax=Pseudomonas syringae group genomosp. 3 TaxID=251701 RepID=UPI0011C45663
MIRIPVTSSDIDSRRIKSSISKLIKHYPANKVPLKLSVVQQTFAKILGYGGYGDLRSQAKKNGAVYSGLPLAMEQFIAPISQRISFYWGSSTAKAESIVSALGLEHLDAFRPIPRAVGWSLFSEDPLNSVVPLATPPVSPKLVLEAVRQASAKPAVQLNAILVAMEPMQHLVAMQAALRPTAQMEAM